MKKPSDYGFFRDWMLSAHGELVARLILWERGDGEVCLTGSMLLIRSDQISARAACHQFVEAYPEFSPQTVATIRTFSRYLVPTTVGGSWEDFDELYVFGCNRREADLFLRMSLGNKPVSKDQSKRSKRLRSGRPELAINVSESVH